MNTVLINEDEILSDLIISSLYEILDSLNNNQGKLDDKLLDEIVRLGQMKKEKPSPNFYLLNNS